jgi:hypothetical protein
MAFDSAVGYTNLPNGNFSPTIFSQKALLELRKSSVVEDITNTDYFGEISKFGDVVTVMREPTITITPYKRGQEVATQTLNDDDFTITVDKANTFQFAIDDLEKRQSHINFEQLASNRAAYELKDEYDTEVLNYMKGIANSANYVGTTSAAVKVAAGATPSSTVFTPLGIMARAKRLLDAANVPSDNRFFVGDPYFYEQLSDENSKLLNNDYDDKGILRNGKVCEGMVRGYKLYESNNLPVAGTGPSAASGSTNHGVLLFGHKSAVATVSQIDKTETFRSQSTFADVVRGLHMYGRGVIRPESLVVVYYTVA